MKKYIKFTVERLQYTPSGLYAVYHSETGMETWTGCFGFQPGDIVEMFDYDGYFPSQIKVNGIITWTEEDKKKAWNRYNNISHSDIIEQAKVQKENWLKHK